MRQVERRKNMTYTEKLRRAENALAADGINSELIARMSPSEILKAFAIEDYDEYNDFMDIMAVKYDI